jgi:hypothetical protein
MGEEFLDEVFLETDRLDLTAVEPAAAVKDPAQVVGKTELVRSLLTDVNFDQAREMLEQAMAAAQPPLERQQREKLIARMLHITNGPASDQSKAYSLGFAVYDEVGPEFLEQAFSA